MVDEFQKKMETKVDSGSVLDCHMKLNEYFMFWDALSDPSMASKFFLALVQCIIKVEKKAAKSRAMSAEEKMIAEKVVHDLYSTIRFMMMYFSLVSTESSGIDKNLLKITQVWTDHRKDSSSVLRVNMDGAIRQLRQLYVTQEDMLRSYVFDLLVDCNPASLENPATIPNPAIPNLFDPASGTIISTIC